MQSKLFSRRRFLQASLTAAGGGAALIGYATQIEPHRFEIVERTMPVAGLPNGWQNRTIVHMSDIHLGPRVDDTYLLRIFAAVRALAPDVVVYTGDFIDLEPEILSHTRRLAVDLPLGKHLTAGVFGNHDYGKNWAQTDLADSLGEILQARGITILRNQGIKLDGLNFLGLDDLWAERCDLAHGIASLPAGSPAIALAHNPDSVDLPGWENFTGWILSGHTHGGQCKPPFLPPPLLPVQNRRYVAGQYALTGNRNLYISRGIGHLLKARFNVRPEITVFRLHPA